MILHVQRVPQTGYSGQFRAGDFEPRSRQVLYHLRSREGLARIHARARDDDQRRRRFEMVQRRNRVLANVERRAVANRHPDHFDLDSVVEPMMMAKAAADEASKIQDVKMISRGYMLRNIPHESFQGPSVSEHSRDQVSWIHLGHSPRNQFNRVVSSVVGQSAHHDGVTRSRRMSSPERWDYLEIVGEVQVGCGRSYLVDAHQPDLIARLAPLQRILI